MNRRNFLNTTAKAAVAGFGALALPLSLPAGSKMPKQKIRVIYSLHAEQQPRPDWPNQGFNFRPVMDRINSTLAANCKDMEFVPCMATGPEQAKEILDADTKASDIDGYIVYQMNCWNRVVQTIAESGRPVIYADFQFGGSGGFLVYNATFLNAPSQNVAFVASSETKDLIDAVKCFKVIQKGMSTSEFVNAVARIRKQHTARSAGVKVQTDQLDCLSTSDCVAQLKSTKLLAVRDQNAGRESEVLGVKVQHVPFAELNQAWEKADKDQAKAIADKWAKEARKVEDVSRETLETSAAMYLAEKKLLENYGAQGITINCLGGFYGGHIHAYPCLGFYQLANEGLVGACECDVRSAVSMLVGTTLTRGRPGYISDPVMDTAKRQIIYAHCVAGSKVFGPSGPTNAFDIMTHSEDRQGASVRSVLPVNYMTTSIKVDEATKEIIFHRAMAVANDPDDRACRTKLCANPVGDFEKLFRYWDKWGWHRVTFYGDLKKPIYALADVSGWKVVEEA
jgi:hypothetical protein